MDERIQTNLLIIAKVLVFLFGVILLGSLIMVEPQPRDVDPLGVGRGLGIEIEKFEYKPVQKAAIGALLSAFLLANGFLFHGKLSTESTTIQWLDRLIWGLAFVVAVIAGWQWLLSATPEGKDARLYLVPVLNLALFFIIAFVIIIGYMFVHVASPQIWQALKGRFKRGQQG